MFAKHLVLSLLASLVWLGGLPTQLRAADTAGGLSEVITSAKSGPWSAAATWQGGKVPGASARVLVKEGHRVVYDLVSDHVIRGINVAGTLSFASDRDTCLK